MPPRTPKPNNNPALPTPISIVHHSDKRVNIPTEELRDFLPDDAQTERTLLYPRDPSLDPQLVWRGKDDQDRHSLEVPSLPIYIQEKIQPQAIIEDLRSNAASTSQSPMQPSLFSDFDGLDFEQMVDFYKHEQNWSNRLILGDSLLVMASLAEKEGLKDHVQMIYIDPPYGIKFNSNWQVSTRRSEVKDGKAEDATRQPEQVKAFRDTWELGIHSYLAYLRDRLRVAFELLTRSGSVFVQISDENLHLVRCIMDEVFGSQNFVNIIAFAKTTGFSGRYLSSVSDYLVWYAKDISQVKYRQLYKEKEAGESGATAYRLLSQLPYDHTYWGPSSVTRLATSDQLTSQGASPNSDQLVRFRGKDFLPPTGLHWKTTVDGMSRLVRAGRMFLVGNTLRYLRLLDDFPVYPLSNTWTDTGIAGFTADKIYVVQTLPKVIERCVLMTTDPGDLVLDPTCGSGTTAIVAEHWGRRWITTDTSRVALTLTRTRLMEGKFPYFLLADSAAGHEKEAELTGLLPHPGNTSSDVRQGFVYERAPHIMLSTISADEEIDTIHVHYQNYLEPLRAELNRLLNQSWEEWQIPRDPSPSWPQPALTAHSRYWQLRRDRQREIDASIARRADTELLYDQPYEDPKRIRVTGPFTVESLSPHRVLSPTEDDQSTSQSTAEEESEALQFVSSIIDNLRKAGVQNTYKGERLKFDTLEPYPGTYLQASGTYTDSVGAPHRVAVHIGPKYGTVGPNDIKEAAKETVKGAGSFDTLIIAGLAFDPSVTEEAKQFGKLTVLITRINPDLAMGDELLKKTGAGNLFMIFGEPDIDINVNPTDKMVTVVINGLDVYDPTTGQIRSASTDDIACWFIDTNYNEEAFFVRHAYFTGADQPYEKLKRALRAEIDESAWSALYSTTSRPFPAPSTGKIAVKVINHYGDEVLKVYELEKSTSLSAVRS